MSAIIEWATDNVEWLFSGIGVSALGVLSLAFRRRSSGAKQVVKNSKNVSQIGGDFTVTNSDD